jgi:hypothetical protein
MASRSSPFRFPKLREEKKGEENNKITVTVKNNNCDTPYLYCTVKEKEMILW